MGNSEVLGLENAWIDIGKGFVLLPVLAFLHAGCRGSVVRWQSGGRLPICHLVLITCYCPILTHSGRAHNSTNVSPAWYAHSCFLRGVLTPVLRALVSFLHDWQREQWFRILNDEERSASLSRLGIKQVIDIKVLLVGGLALLNSGEGALCDGIFVSGHVAKCDESGSTRESGTLKKTADDQLSPFESTPCTRVRVCGLNAVRARIYTDRLLASSSKALEGCDRYVVNTVGHTTFNGHVVIRSSSIPLSSYLLTVLLVS